jgi:sigma-B regulation protein RsbU (phosphoserine phosphatase)
MKILIVDDERFNLNLLTDLLKPDYKIMVAKNGEQALKAARAAPPPDLILLDIMMPEMDGYEVCRRLKVDETTRDIPVIFITAMGETSDETKGLELGAVDYITKPISPPIVQARVKTQLTLKHNLEELQRAYKIIESQKERMEKELNVGREIQMNMIPLVFPPFPDHKEFSIYATLHPAREVGGDFYDFFFVDENRLCFCIGDVSGKGVPAALFMAVTKTLIKSRATDDLSTASILTHVNDELCRDNKAFMFVTIFIGILDIRTGNLIYTNAGHNPPYIKQKAGSIMRLDQRHGPVVGAMPDLVYKEEKTRLSKDDMLFMYTDGITEAKDPMKKLFSEKKLAELLTSGDYESAEEAVQETISEVKKFEGAADQADDITVLAVQFLRIPEEISAPTLKLTVHNDLEEIKRVKEAFNAFSEQCGIQTPIRRKINVVFDEMLNNIISYAYRDDDDHHIDIKAELSGEQLTISIMDDGIPFNPFGVETPDTGLSLEDRKIGGVGVHLVRNFMDKVSYQRRIDNNVITLTKNLNENSDP